jgi:2-keto-4-pentenoate hydratase/2-oxohepta-3-ene-1,7-dioic acid hydratase in catechol pathway
MKLLRFGPSGAERPGLLVDGEGRVDVSGFGEDYDEGFFASGGLTRLAQWYAQNGSRCPRIGADERIGPPVRRPSKIVCIGRNYRAHAQETGAEIPSEPLLFMKATTALAGPYDNLVRPRGSDKLDYEVELAVVIGRRALYVREQDALDYVAGFALMNDYTERGFQRDRGGQWTKGKSADGFAPLGPLLVTTDEVTPTDVSLWLRVNGEMRQSAGTRDMIFPVPHLVSYVSQFMTLLPGDVISTGTPEGVGIGRNPPSFLVPGDVVEYGADQLGQGRQQVVDALDRF